METIHSIPFQCSSCKELFNLKIEGPKVMEKEQQEWQEYLHTMSASLEKKGGVPCGFCGAACFPVKG